MPFHFTRVCRSVHERYSSHAGTAALVYILGMSPGKYRLSAAKAEAFLGTARLGLQGIDFSRRRTMTTYKHREVSKEAIRSLFEVFQSEGCRRFDSENFLDVFIHRDSFETAIHRAGLNEDNFKLNSIAKDLKIDSVVELAPDYPVECFDGLRRVRAAELFLENNDQWWIVNLYDISSM